MNGDIAAFSQALSIASANTLGGKSTQLGNWRKTLKVTATTALFVVSLAVLINHRNFSITSIGIGILAGISGGIGLPLAYRAFSAGPISFVSPAMSIIQTFILVIFAVTVKNDSLSKHFFIIVILSVIGLTLCSFQTKKANRTNLNTIVLTFFSALFFSGFSVIMTFAGKNEILFAIFGVRIGVMLMYLIYSVLDKSVSHAVQKSNWRKYALFSGIFEVTSNILYVVAINHLELSKVGIYMASTPVLSTLIAVKILGQKPTWLNWSGIFISSFALLLNSLN